MGVRQFVGKKIVEIHRSVDLFLIDFINRVIGLYRGPIHGCGVSVLCSSLPGFYACSDSSCLLYLVKRVKEITVNELRGYSAGSGMIYRNSYGGI